MIEQTLNNILDFKYSVHIMTAMSGLLTATLILHLDQSLQLLPNLI